LDNIINIEPFKATQKSHVDINLIRLYVVSQKQSNQNTQGFSN